MSQAAKRILRAPDLRYSYAEAEEEALERDSYSEAKSGKPKLVRYGGPTRLYMLSSFKKPEVEGAEEYFKKNHPWDWESDKQYSLLHTTFGRDIPDNTCAYKCDPFREGIDSDFTEFGPGLSSYFTMLKAFGWLFFIFSILTLPAMIINATGGDYLGFFTATTVGNLFEPFDFSELAASDESEALTFQVALAGCGSNDTCIVERSKVLNFYVALDVIIVCAFLVTLEYLRYFHRKEGIKFAKRSPNLEYYTIEVDNLPPDTNYDEIKSFFEEKCGEVNDVQVIDSTQQIISNAIRYSNMKHEFEDLASDLKARTDKYGDDERKYQREYRKYKKLKNELEDFWAEYHDQNPENTENMDQTFVNKAFVTFETRDAHKKSMELFSVERNCTNCYGSARYRPCYEISEEEVSMRGSRLLVTDSPPPSTIVWENIAYPDAKRKLRTCASFFCAFLLLFASWIASTIVGLIARTFEVDFEIEELQQDDCIDEKAFIQNLTSIFNDTNIAEVIENEDVQLLFCFCRGENGDLTNIILSGGACSQFTFSALQNLGASFFGALLVVIINQIILNLLNYTVTFEKHYDVVIEESAILVRVFIATYINSAVIIILENSDTRSLFGFFLSSIGLSQGEYSDVSADWYGDVGFELILLAILNIFGPHVSPFMKYAYRNWAKKHAEPISQRELNSLYLGPGFSISVRYAQMLVMIFFCFTYSGGMPVMNILASLAMFVTFWVDKFFFLRVCRNPPVYSNLITNLSRSILKYATIIHLIFSIAMFSAPDIWPESLDDRQSIVANVLLETIFGDTSLNSTLSNTTALNSNPSGLTFRSIVLRLLRPSNIPLTLLLFAIITVLLLANFRSFYSLLDSQRRRFVKFLMRNDVTNIDVEEDEKNFAKVSALKRDRKLLKGISSYNILANPAYQRNFALPEHFRFEDVHTSGEIVVHLAKDIRGKDMRLVGASPTNDDSV